MGLSTFKRAEKMLSISFHAFISLLSIIKLNANHQYNINID